MKQLLTITAVLFCLSASAQSLRINGDSLSKERLKFFNKVYGTDAKNGLLITKRQINLPTVVNPIYTPIYEEIIDTLDSFRDTIPIVALVYGYKSEGIGSVLYAMVGYIFYVGKSHFFTNVNYIKLPANIRVWEWKIR